MYFVYVLFSHKDKKLYTGLTENIEKRINEHNQGKNISTKNRRPFELIYYEAYCEEMDARGREVFLKSGSGKRYLKKQLRVWFAKKFHQESEM